MDSVEITTELNKINRVHSSLDETNPITYIIFQETFRDKLNASQHEWIDFKVADLNHKLNETVHKQMSNIDMGVALASLSDKTEESGTLRQM